MKLLLFSLVRDLRNQHHLGIEWGISVNQKAQTLLCTVLLKEIYFQEVLIWEGRVALENSGRKFKKHTVHPYGGI